MIMCERQAKKYRNQNEDKQTTNKDMVRYMEGWMVAEILEVTDINLTHEGGTTYCAKQIPF